MIKNQGAEIKRLKQVIKELHEEAAIKIERLQQQIKQAATSQSEQREIHELLKKILKEVTHRNAT